MVDSKRKSFIESIINIIIGVTISFVTNLFVLPLFGMPYKLSSFGYISLIYTSISLLRSYVIRRIFAHGIYEYFLERVNRHGN